MSAPRASLSAYRVRVLMFMAWRNLWRNPVRSGLTVSAFAFGLTMMIAYAALIEGVNRQMVGYATDLSLGQIEIHRQRFIDDQDLYALLPDALVERLNDGEISGLRAAPRLYAAALASAGDYSTGALLRAIDPALETRVTTVHEHVRDGTFRFDPQPVPGAGPDGTTVSYPGVVVGNHLAKTLKLRVGSELILVTQAADGSIGNGLFQVTGILGSVDPAIDRMGVLMSLKAFRSLMAMPEGVHEVVVTTADVNTLQATQARIEADLKRWGYANAPERDGGKAVVRRWDQINPAVADMLALQDEVTWIVSVIFFGLAGLGMLNTMLMSVFERSRELAILLALGMGRGWLVAMVLLESAFLSLVSAAVGSSLGIALALRLQEKGWDFSSYLPEGFDFQGIVFEPIYRGYLTPAIVYESVAMMMGIALLASIVPSWRTTRLNLVSVMK